MRFDEGGNQLRIARLRDRGVSVWGAEHVFVDEDVQLESIENGAEIQSGFLSGPELMIGSGSVVGASGPARVSNCQIGRGCELGSGSYVDATILDGARVRGFAEVRGGTLLEEQTEAAHCVAFKNTILTATSIVGSLVNFCDIYLSGGTSREDHSEVGSGAIHFNFDPRGDKWGSRVGDIRGVLLRSAPCFVGGQVGLVGPICVGFGSVLAAGSTVRKDVEENVVHISPAAQGPGQIGGFDRRVYGSAAKKLLVTSRLVGTLQALACWYENFRERSSDEFEARILGFGRERILHNIKERVKRVERLISKLPTSIRVAGHSEGATREHERLIDASAEIGDALSRIDETEPPAESQRRYLELLDDSDHLGAVRGLTDEDVRALSEWLAGIERQPERALEELGVLKRG